MGVFISIDIPSPQKKRDTQKHSCKQTACLPAPLLLVQKQELYLFSFAPEILIQPARWER